MTCVTLRGTARPLRPTGENTLSLYLLLAPTHYPSRASLEREDLFARMSPVPYRGSVTAFFWNLG